MKIHKRLYNKAKRSNLQDDWEAYCKIEFHKHSDNTKRGSQYLLQKAVTSLVVTIGNFGGTSELNIKASTIFLHYSCAHIIFNVYTM